MNLRGHIQSEKIKLPRELFSRSLAWTLLHGAVPFIYLGLSLSVARVAPWPIWAQLPLHFLLLLAAHRAFQTQVHDLSHRVFSEDLALNDVLGNLFAAGWTGTHVQSYRVVHFQHHAHNGSNQDPEYVSLADVKCNGGLAQYVLRYVLALHAGRLFRKYYGPRQQPKHTSSAAAAAIAVPRSAAARIFGLVNTKWAIVLAQCTLLASFTWIARAPWLYALWLYLAVSWSPMLSGLRFMVEHPGTSALTVTTHCSWLERVYFAPLGFHNHFEHHVWPTLPPYRLRGARKHLESVGYYGRYPETRGHGFLSPLLGSLRSPPQSSTASSPQ